MEAIILAGGRAERLGDAAGGRPKSLVEVAGRPLVGVSGRAALRAGRCRARDRQLRGGRRGALRGGAVRPRRRRGRSRRAGTARARAAGIRHVARERSEAGDVLALNGDELVAVDFVALLAEHRRSGAAATITVAQPESLSGSSSLGATTASRVSARVGRCRTGSAAASTCSVRRRSSASRQGRSRDVDVSGARRRRAPRSLPPRRPLVDREHAERPAGRATEYVPSTLDWHRLSTSCQERPLC